MLSYMVETKAKAGLTYKALKNVHARSGIKGIAALMTGAKEGQLARLTSITEIIAKLIYHLNKQL